MAKKEEHGFRLSENSLSLGLGILVVVVIGALILNYIGSRSPQKGEEIVSGEQTTEEQNQNTETSLPTKHKVTQGEDLWKISERYYKSGYNWVDIAQANNLANPDLLSVDMELTIPNVTPIVLPVTGSVTETKAET
ncbi:MAG: LysM peptidoglycan-binding domain-containing protein, partial [bacterium]|nr:LysM peptidoglycan-binding domain-containing protein [bacterium]